MSLLVFLCRPPECCLNSKARCRSSRFLFSFLLLDQHCCPLLLHGKTAPTSRHETLLGSFLVWAARPRLSNLLQVSEMTMKTSKHRVFLQLVKAGDYLLIDNSDWISLQIPLPQCTATGVGRKINMQIFPMSVAFEFEVD